jgi:hypothetical protein
MQVEVFIASLRASGEHGGGILTVLLVTPE